jgi:nascent polypeptide-associated complex subunit beta
LDNLRRLAEQFQEQMPGVEAGASIGTAQDDDDLLLVFLYSPLL